MGVPIYGTYFLFNYFPNTHPLCQVIIAIKIYKMIEMWTWSVAGGRTRVLHRNLLLPLQGRVRQPGGTEGEGISGSEEEEEARDEMPEVARAPRERPRRTTKLKSRPLWWKMPLLTWKTPWLLFHPSLSQSQGMRMVVRKCMTLWPPILQPVIPPL